MGVGKGGGVYGRASTRLALAMKRLLRPTWKRATKLVEQSKREGDISHWWTWWIGWITCGRILFLFRCFTCASTARFYGGARPGRPSRPWRIHRSGSACSAAPPRRSDPAGIYPAPSAPFCPVPGRCLEHSRRTDNNTNNKMIKKKKKKKKKIFFFKPQVTLKEDCSTRWK